MVVSGQGEKYLFQDPKNDNANVNQKIINNAAFREFLRINIA